ncbi:metallophosphoesterase family protein [Geitlerinema calcuttense]|uniref:metallophosphoesterase family protein n=1 Tax=Geitlerinema calcuttense TaxID=1471433 RepID=UPI00255BD8D4|nr:metallophosphoesterase [Geitlerinema calcuttense]
MRYAIFGDIHANLEALEVVLADAKASRVTHYCCLGDVVGYNANPRECLDIVRQMNCPIVKGNHDEQASNDDDFEGINPLASFAMQWTRDQLSAEEKQYLRDLKMIRQVGAFTIVHATLDTPHRWGYVFDQLAAAASFSYQNTSICFLATRMCLWLSHGTPLCMGALGTLCALSWAKSISSMWAVSVSPAMGIRKPPMRFMTR